MFGDYAATLLSSQNDTICILYYHIFDKFTIFVFKHWRN